MKRATGKGVPMPDLVQKKFRAHAHIVAKAAEDESGDLTIEGVASTSDVDRDGQVVDQESLARAARKAKSLKLFWQHRWDAPIGKVTAIDSAEGKLYIKATIGRDFNLGGQNVNDIRTAIQQGIVDALSIGFAAKEEQANEKAPPILKVTDLFEISVVTIPANQNALFSIAKAAGSPYGVDFEFKQSVVEDPPDTNSALRFELDEAGDELTDEDVEAALAVICGATSEIQQDAGLDLVQRELSECLELMRS